MPAPGAPRAAAEELGVGVGLAFTDLLAFAEGLGEADALGVGVADGAGVAETIFGAASSASRNRSSAVVPTSCTTCCDPLPGTATVMMLLPCCWTEAPVNPAELTRWFMIEIAVVMSAAEGGTLCGVTAFSVTVVPLDRSRPS